MVSRRLRCLLLPHFLTPFLAFTLLIGTHELLDANFGTEFSHVQMDLSRKRLGRINVTLRTSLKGGLRPPYFTGYAAGSVTLRERGCEGELIIYSYAASMIHFNCLSSHSVMNWKTSAFSGSLCNSWYKPSHNFNVTSLPAAPTRRAKSSLPLG